MDYKTDRFSNDISIEEAENILRKRHSQQLSYYKYAIEKMFSKKVSQTIVYSFDLSKAVEL